MTPPDSTVADARKGNWVDAYAPAWTRPYLRLSRADRPIGTWLLLLPGWWSIAMAAPAGSAPDLWMMLLFGIGALAMRGAGCTFNDLVDRDFDGRVERTRSRPLPSGQVTPGQARIWLVVQALIGLAVLLQMGSLAILLGVASLGLIAIYPFMKRVTWWPQFFLGLAFNWGALMGEAAVAGRVSAAAIALYLAGILWTLGYDTVYAHQDKEDDALIGVKSTARLFGTRSRVVLFRFYAGMMVLMLAVGPLAALAWPYYIGLTVAALMLYRQNATLDFDDGAACLVAFRAHRDVGLVILAGFVVARLIG
ncbi:MAG: 4-hydroxybenzoate octaprenyltransferase [Alphaproteobacteria bacterium]|jgi:4-hydroxybenzoate polyprenyltransferase|nr:4-hydroxybenzoate octaprenyltransferase [Alphaproteobacteria bacterium]